MKFNWKKLIIITIFLSITSGAFAQATGMIKGRVLDSSSGDPMIGVTVVVMNAPGVFGITDINGSYVIGNAPVGSQTVRFSMMGYQTATTTVNVPAGGSARANVALSFRTAKTIVVKAKKISNTQASLLTKQKKAPSAQDAISAEQISKSPDSDAADAAKRVTGVTIVNGKNVFIRGLGERYSGVMLAGSAIPSPDPDKRVVPLDIFPVGLLDNIVVIKTYMPNLPAEFGGGLVQLNLKEYPEETKVTAKLGTGYHSLTTFKNFYTSDGGKYDWLGFDDGTRELPSGIKDARLNSPYYTADRKEAIGESFHNNYTPSSSTALMPLSISGEFGTTYEISKQSKLGILASAMFSESYKNKEIEYTAYDSSAEITRDYKVDQSDYNTSKGALVSLAYNPNANNKFRYTGFISHQSKDRTQVEKGFTSEDNNPTVAGAVSSMKYYRMQFVTTSLFFNQLTGEHYFKDFLDSKLKWMTSYSRAVRDEPSRRSVYLIDYNSTGDYVLEEPEDAKIYFNDHTEDVIQFNPEYIIPFSQWSGLKSKFILGFDQSYREREANGRSFAWDSDTFDPNGVSEPLEDLFTLDNIVGTLPVTSTELRVIENTLQTDAYTGKLNVISGYSYVDMPLVPKLRMVLGLRYEYADMDTISFNPDKNEVTELDYEPLKRNQYLPAVNTIFSPNRKMNIRLAYSKTVSRPDFREVTEFKYSPFVSSEVYKGNPALEETEIHNYDFRIEYFPTAAELIAFSVFYKDLIKPIELLALSGSTGADLYQFENANKADNIGAEVELRKGLGFVKALEDFSILANFAYIYSQITVGKDGYFTNYDGQTTRYTNTKRPLQGQSPIVVNAGLNYEHEDWGLSTTLLYNYIGEKIMGVGLYSSDTPRGDIYEEPVSKLDFVVKQKIGKNGSLKIAFANILDPEIKQSQELTNASGNKETVITKKYKIGREIKVGYSQKF